MIVTHARKLNYAKSKILIFQRGNINIHAIIALAISQFLHEIITSALGFSRGTVQLKQFANQIVRIFD